MGSIEKIGDRQWRIRVRLGYDPIGKKYLRSPSRTVHGSKADAREALRRYREEVLFAIEHPELATLFKDYANTNYDNRAAEGGSPLAFPHSRLSNAGLLSGEQGKQPFSAKNCLQKNI